MKLLTEIVIPSPLLSFNYNDTILMMGSCFAENIGKKLQDSGFDVDINPFGILYNPLTIASSLQRMLDGHAFEAKELFQHNGQWHSFGHHGSFSAAKVADVLESINRRFESAISRLQTATVLNVTFGTSWVYRQQESGEVVANCHKLPEKHFVRHRLTVDEIVASWETLLSRIQQLNPSLRLMFTVSPIRHWKDGAHENQLSKSVLLLAIDRLQKQYNVAYFPAYEIMMDELRDYRFYASDMLHPSEQAIDYIWERFIAVSFDVTTRGIMKEVESLRRALSHRPLHVESDEYKQFEIQTAQKKARLLQKYPTIRLR